MMLTSGFGSKVDIDSRLSLYMSVPQRQQQWLWNWQDWNFNMDLENGTQKDHIPPPQC